VGRKKKVAEKRIRNPIAFTEEPIIKGMQSAAKVCAAYNVDFETLSDFLKSKGLKITDENSVLNPLALTLVRKQFTPANSKKTLLLQGRPRVMAICRAYNISVDTLVAFLKTKSVENISIHSVIDTSILELIDNEFKKDKIAKDRIRGKTEIQFKSNGNSDVNGMTYREPVLYIERNRFENFRKHVSYQNLPIIESFFSDFEANTICSKMSSSYSRSICKQLGTHKSEFEKLNYQIHYIANKALGIYGGKLLTFIYELRNMNFACGSSAVEIRTYLKVIPDFPILTIDSGGASFKISFFLKQTRQKSMVSDVRVFSSKTNQEIGKVDADGCVITRLEDFKPQLRLFYRSLKDRKFSIYSGIESGTCEVCGKELTDPTSLRIGLGPICARGYGLDNKIYNLQ
jgi:hypothetical protein